MTHNEIVSNLNDLIKVCKDGCEGFKTCAEDSNVDMPQLKSLLTQRREECGRAADELRALVLQQGSDPVDSTTVSGSLHRGWLNLKTAVAGKDNVAVLEECERGEDVAKDAYRKALAKDWPAPIRTVIERQYQGVLHNHEQIKSLRDEAKRAHHVS